MAVVTQVIAPARSYSPFEGMSEAQRLASAVPRGLIRFDTVVGQTITAKPINDSYDLQVTCSLPDGFAYILSGLSFQVAVDTISDYDDTCQGRIFNGLPTAAPGGAEHAIFDMTEVASTVALRPMRILSYGRGTLATWFHHPFTRNLAGTGLSFLINYHNSAAPAAATGLVSFHLSIYQYELNQLVRFPLNYPTPVGSR